MIKLKESTILASKKFSAKKGRSIFSGCTIALGVILIAMFLMGTKGVFDVMQQNFKDSLADAPYALEVEYKVCQEGDIECNREVINIDSWKERYKEYEIQEMKQIGRNTLKGFTLTAFSKVEKALSITELDDIFIQDFLYSDYQFTDTYEGKIPVIIPRDYVAQYEFDSKDLSEKERFLKTKDALNKYLGKSYKLSEMDAEFKTTKIDQIEVVIVGYGDAMLAYDTIGSMATNSIIFPTWAKDKNEKLNEYFKKGNEGIYILKFKDTKSKSDYYAKRVKETFESQNFEFSQIPEEVTSRYYFLQEILRVIRGMGIALGVIMLVISSLFAFSTISKIVDDSKKEIGIFRAFGAVKNDIRKIYFIYTILLSNLGFFLGLIIAIIINAAISIIWGENLFYSLVNFGNNFDVTKPLLMFASIPIGELLILYIAIIILGILSALIPVWRASSIEPISVIRDE